MSAVEVNLAAIDCSGFCKEIEAIRRDAQARLGPEDLKHLRRTELKGRFFSFLGYCTAWLFPNPLSALFLSLGNSTRWVLAHHILHKGYDRVPGVPARYTSKCFAQGWRRYVDWFDWMHPSAWDYEHNSLHHYHTGEDADPDLTERYLEFLRKLRIPYFLKYFFIALASITWKFTYYAPNTMSVLDPATFKRRRHESIVFLTIKRVLNFGHAQVRALWLRCYLPYVSVHFVILPLLFLPLGTQAVWYVLINKILAEFLANLHGFLVIVPNHTADDLYRFGFHYDHKEQFYVTQVLGSANYHCGSETIDYLSMWLNYQIEHHLFPDLPMTKYREIQPKVKALCLKYGIPYRQESLFQRVARMLDICVGKTSMRSLESFPVKQMALERAASRLSA